jgi:hypothetical protein
MGHQDNPGNAFSIASNLYNGDSMAAALGAIRGALAQTQRVVHPLCPKCGKGALPSETDGDDSSSMDPSATPNKEGDAGAAEVYGPPPGAPDEAIQGGPQGDPPGSTTLLESMPLSDNIEDRRPQFAGGPVRNSEWDAEQDEYANSCWIGADGKQYVGYPNRLLGKPFPNPYAGPAWRPKKDGGGG